MGLNPVDLKILDFAVQHGLHYSDEEIAKKLRLKSSTTNYSINKLRKNNVFQGFRYKIDYRKLGLNGLAWVLFSIGSEVEDQGELMKKLVEFPQVHVAAFITGEKDFAIKIVGKDVASINALILELTTKFGEVLKQPEVLFVTDQFKTHNLCVGTYKGPADLDEIDLSLLDKKMIDPDKTLREIGKEISVHKNTISRRWRKLRKAKIVLKKSPLVNPDNYFDAGMALRTMVLFDVPPEFRARFSLMLCGLPQVHELHALLSGHSFLSVIRTKNVDELYSLISKISFRAGFVTNTVSHLFLKTTSHKPNYIGELRKKNVFSF